MDEIFKENIKKIAVNYFGSLSKMAAALNISSSYLSQYVNLKVKPGYEFFKGLAEQGVDLNEVFGTEVRPPAQKIVNMNVGAEKYLERIIKEKEEQIELLKKEKEEQAALFKMLLEKK